MVQRNATHNRKIKNKKGTRINRNTLMSSAN